MPWPDRALTEDVVWWGGSAEEPREGRCHLRKWPLDLAPRGLARLSGCGGRGGQAQDRTGPDRVPGNGHFPSALPLSLSVDPLPVPFLPAAWSGDGSARLGCSRARGVRGGPCRQVQTPKRPRQWDEPLHPPNTPSALPAAPGPGRPPPAPGSGGRFAAGELSVCGSARWALSRPASLAPHHAPHHVLQAAARARPGGPLYPARGPVHPLKDICVGPRLGAGHTGPCRGVGTWRGWPRSRCGRGGGGGGGRGRPPPPTPSTAARRLRLPACPRLRPAGDSCIRPTRQGRRGCLAAGLVLPVIVHRAVLGLRGLLRPVLAGPQPVCFLAGGSGSPLCPAHESSAACTPRGGPAGCGLSFLPCLAEEARRLLEAPGTSLTSLRPTALRAFSRACVVSGSALGLGRTPSGQL